MMQEVKIEKLVHGGQGLGQLPNGRKVFVWNALPGETVKAGVFKSKRSYAEAIAEEIIEASPERIMPRDENYLATSPWQILTLEAENRYKRDIVAELFARERVELPTHGDTVQAGEDWAYRNKMEYSFWGDDDGLHLALYRRGSHGKQVVQGSSLAKPEIDTAANTLVTQLSGLKVRAGDLKTVVVRCDGSGHVAASLFVKRLDFLRLELPAGLHGLRVYYSDPKSPASVPTKQLYELGDVTLHDALLGKEFTYDVDSFFQVNLPVFEKALARIKEYCTEARLIDMYAGVGSIGLSVATKQVTLVELDAATAAMARLNAAASGLKTEVIEGDTAHTIQSIVSDQPVIFDPPRAGLHDKVVQRVLGAKPGTVVYLSCNPATQARDLAKLQQAYDIDFFEVYNFFPHTPHIETLAVLKRKALRHVRSE